MPLSGCCPTFETVKSFSNLQVRVEGARVCATRTATLFFEPFLTHSPSLELSHCTVFSVHVHRMLISFFGGGWLALRSDVLPDSHIQANISAWTPTSPPDTEVHKALNVTGGALFMTTVNFMSKGLDWGGGCWWVLNDKVQRHTCHSMCMYPASPCTDEWYGGYARGGGGGGRRRSQALEGL